jgi:hypothetical protein
MTNKLAAVLVVALGLCATQLRAAQPPDFKSLPSSDIKVLPPSDIKVQPLPLDTKAPPPPAPASAPAPCNTCETACPAACKPSCGLGLGLHLPHLDRGCGCNDHPCLEKLCAWATYRPCHCTPLTCCDVPQRPIPDNYTWFLWIGCVEGPAGSCCNNRCNGGCNGCAK